MIPDHLFTAMRGRFEPHGLPGLQAVTVCFDESERHLRIDFHFDGTSENVELAELEQGTLNELIADVWAGVASVGFAVFFDQPSMRRALRDPQRLFPR